GGTGPCHRGAYRYDRHGGFMTPFVEPQMQAILNRLRAGPQTDFKTMPIVEARRQSDAATIPWSDGAPEMRTRDLTVDAGAHELRARLYLPTEGPVVSPILYIHGGGWAFGSIDTHDGTMRNLAKAAQRPV